jgi:CheY-like chemotaxis protein
MSGRPRILLLDDDQDFLELYREMLSTHLPSLPEVRTANSAARALALLESEPFDLLIVDLQMPRMDGLQVLAIARRKYPQLRLMVLTAQRDEQFRTRAYAMGVDQYWLKPESDQEIALLMEAIESLLTRAQEGGFRGVQSKSLVDIIQLECLSQSSCVLKINNGTVEGKIWIQKGEVIDAELPDLTGEAAFQRILSWKAGSFEILPADPSRPRSIFTSYQGLLLNTAQALDEAASLPSPEAVATAEGKVKEVSSTAPLLAELSQLEGVECVLAIDDGKAEFEHYWGLENPKPLAAWARATLQQFRQLGDQLQVGNLTQVVAAGPDRKLALAVCGGTQLCVGFPPSFSTDEVRETMKQVLTKWAS